MEELRPDVFDSEAESDDSQQIDDRVLAPGEALDDRDSEEPEWEVDEELSSTNTDYGTFETAL